jgi:DNA-binding NarL/FixJ family response regulator
MTMKQDAPITRLLMDWQAGDAQAPSRLGEPDPRKARIIELNLFGGLSYDQIAEVMGISPATVDRGLCFPRAWL